MWSEAASTLKSLPGQHSLVFDLCYYVLASLSVRAEASQAGRRNHPLASWLAAMSASFAGSLIANPLLGKPVLAAVSDEYQVMLASVVWWAVFYSPGDLVYSLAKNKLLYLPICVVKEIIRGKKLVGGISAARAVFPDNELIIIIIAVIKGNGSSFMKPITKLILGDWAPSKSEILKMSATSKACAAGVLLLLLHNLGFISNIVSEDCLYVSIVTTFLLIKLSSILADPVDPFKPVEDLVSFVMLGGMWENMQTSAELTKEE